MSRVPKYPILPPPVLVGEGGLRPLPDMFGQPVVPQHQMPSLVPPSLPDMYGRPVAVPPNPRPFSEPSNKQVYVYRGEGNNGEVKVFGTFAKLKKFLLDRHSGIYPKTRYSKEEFLEVSQGWGFTIEIVDYY